MKQRLLLLIAILFCTTNSFSENKKIEPLTLTQAVLKSPIHTKNIGKIHWLKDGEHYSRIERNKEGKLEVVAYHVKNQTKKIIIKSEWLTDSITKKQIGIKSFTFSKDNSKVLIFNNTKRVWRLNTKGDYWVLSLKDHTLKKIGRERAAATMMFAKFSPDASKVAYVSENNLYIENLETGKSIALTEDGCEHIINGTFDWVYEEEFSCRDGFRWSPDGNYIAYWQSDTQGTGVFDIINNIDNLYPTIQHFPYPKAGTKNSAVKVGYVKATGGKTNWINLPGDPRNNYIPRMHFIPKSNELFIQQMNRAQNTNKVWIATIETGELKNIFKDTDKAWVETNDQVKWLKKGKFFTWLSERSGWRHLYRISRDGKKIEPITKGNFDIIKITGMDLKKGYVYFIATEKNYTQRYLFQAKLLGKSKCKRLSPINQEGQHKYDMSPTGKWAVHTFSNSLTPPMIDMVSFPEHKSVRIIAENKKASLQFKALHLNPKEFVKTKSGDIELDAYMIKPIDFDPTKKYPVIIEVYGEPAGSTVQDKWEGGNLWAQFMANQGYIYISIENRGANAPRGREWRKCIYGEVGTYASLDQTRGIIDLARQYKFIDIQRIGITGWSGGGSQTLNCMFRYPEVFSTGIAVAAVSDQRLYDTIYQERYMNTPQNNPEGYRKGSPISHVKGLEGNLLIIHGTGDDNVHYQCCERLVNELIKEKKIFYQLSYPMRSHGIYERSGTTLHLRKSMLDFWLKNLPAGAK